MVVIQDFFQSWAFLKKCLSPSQLIKLNLLSAKRLSFCWSIAALQCYKHVSV